MYVDLPRLVRTPGVGGLDIRIGNLAPHGDGRRRVDQAVLQVPQELGRQLVVAGPRLGAGRPAPRPDTG